jgi:uncharacterized protein with ParB-like and HNH nuclease domain
MSTGMIDSPQSSIGKLMRDNVFHVPPYQRDYRWTVEKVGQLFDDLDAAIERADDRYFLGLMVTVAKEYKVWNRAAIIRRQNYLAELGVQAWRFQ